MVGVENPEMPCAPFRGFFLSVGPSGLGWILARSASSRDAAFAKKTQSKTLLIDADLLHHFALQACGYNFAPYLNAHHSPATTEPGYH